MDEAKTKTDGGLVGREGERLDVCTSIPVEKLHVHVQNYSYLKLYMDIASFQQYNMPNFV